MPATLDLVEALRADGVPAVVSGAGPTVLAFTDAAGTAAGVDVAARCPAGWTVHHLAVDTAGIRAG